MADAEALMLPAVVAAGSLEGSGPFLCQPRAHSPVLADPQALMLPAVVAAGRRGRSPFLGEVLGAADFACADLCHVGSLRKS